MGEEEENAMAPVGRLRPSGTRSVVEMKDSSIGGMKRVVAVGRCCSEAPRRAATKVSAGNRNNRPIQAGVVFDSIKQQELKEQEGTVEGSFLGSEFSLLQSIDFEAEKVRLLEERKQLEELLEELDVVSRRKQEDAEAKGARVSEARRNRYRRYAHAASSSPSSSYLSAEEQEEESKGKPSEVSRERGESMEESLVSTSESSSMDAVTTLLQERRHLKLLSREEEAELIEQAQFCFKVDDAIQELNRMQGTFPSYEQLSQALYTKDKRISAKTLRKKHLDAMEARRFMLDHNVRLVVHLAHRYKGKGVALGDLVQEGIQGLLTAIEKFDLSRNLKFSTYATWWIRQSCIRSLSHHSRDVRLPVHVTDTLQKYQKLVKAGAGGNGNGLDARGKKVSIENLASQMGCKTSKLKAVLESTRTAISLEVLCGANNSGHNSMEEPLNNLEDPAVQHSREEDEEEDESISLLVEAALKQLPPRERNILRMRFGLTPIDDMCLSLVDIGAAYGLTRERVRQMEARALNKLRQPRLNTKLKKYIEPEGQIGSDPEA